MAASSGQNCAEPGVSTDFPIFDDRTSTPTKGGDGLMRDPQGIGNLPVKPGGNPAGGRGGKAC